MSDRTALMFGGTFDGFLSAVFEAYTRRPMPAEIVEADNQQHFGVCYETVKTDPVKAGRVRRGIRSQMGNEAYDNAWKCFLSEHPERGNFLYRYLRLGFQIQQQLVRSLTDERVMTVNKLAALVSREARHLLQFIRLGETETGVYYAEITPTYPILPLVMPHFAHRLNTQAFVIYDKTHEQAGLYNGHEWMLTDAATPHRPAYTEAEQQYRRLWKTFYDAVAITERINPKLRQNFMPKKYWRNMVEMTESPPPRQPLLSEKKNSPL